MSVANIGKLQENTTTLCKIGCDTLRVSTIRGSRYVYLEKLKCPPLPSGVKRRMRNIRMECRRRRIPNVRHPVGMSAEQNSGCETSGWNVQCHSPRSAALRWCVRICLWIPKNSPQSWIALVIKKLSKHQNLTQFD